MKEARDLFARCTFSNAQLNALKTLYYKYFRPHVPEQYDGTASVAIWYKNTQWETSKGKDVNHNNYGFVIPEAAEDPLWEEHFGSLLPFMAKDAVITKLPPGATMHPHIDRSWRAQAIYFPIEGCTPLCFSEYYDLPKSDTPNRQSQTSFPPPVYQYAIHDQAYLTNVHEWHGVRNTSDQTRIAFGWNFDSTKKWTYEQCLDKMIELGYARA
jgi:hypothetical protein